MKKLNTGGALTAKPKSNGKTHPSIEVGGRLEALIKQFIVIEPDYKRFKAQHETLSKDIGAETRLVFFDRFSGLVPESSTMLAHVDGKEIKLIVKDRYSQSLTDDTPLVAAIGREKVDKYFHWRTKYTLDFDKIQEDKQEAFAAAIEEARVKLGITDTAVIAKQFIEPNVGFHDSRTLLLTPEENRKLDAVMPVVAHPQL